MACKIKVTGQELIIASWNSNIACTSCFLAVVWLCCFTLQ